MPSDEKRIGDRASEDDGNGPDSPAPSLRERFPGYLTSFARGLVIAGLVGIGLTGITDLSLGSAVGQTWMLFGAYLLLVGGIRGGGYNNLSLGAMEALAKRRRQVPDPAAVHYADLQHEEKRRDPMARLRKGLRPPANPDAFWQVVGGFAYIGAGVVLLI